VQSPRRSGPAIDRPRMAIAEATEKIYGRLRLAASFKANMVPDLLAGGLRVELFRAEKVAEVASASVRKCRLCGKELELVRSFMDAATGKIIHTFECECGDRTWDG
jgi:hypothetical protein